MVRDGEVGGSNPLAPTGLFKHLQTPTSQRLYAINGAPTVRLRAFNRRFALVPRIVPTVRIARTLDRFDDGVRLRVHVAPRG